jgi:dephospho-CoA kinase
MLKIGLTGGIGSGKTSVAKVFEVLGISVYYSDFWAKEITITDKFVINSLKNEFGKNIYLKTGNLNKALLSKIIFENAQNREKVNSIIHPAVAKHFEIWAEKHKKNNEPYIIKEAAILFESGAYKQVDKIITVFANKEQRINRTMLRDNSSKETILSKIKSQIPEQEKIKKSDFVIYNNDKNMIIPQIIEIHKKILLI